MKLTALFATFIFLLALGGDSVAATNSSATATPSANATPKTNNTSSTLMGPMTKPVDNSTQAPPTPARAIVGKVIWVKGTFSAIAPDKSSRPLIKGDAVLFQDTLVTAKNSQAQIVFSDDTLMTFKEETIFFIENYEFSTEVKERSVGKYVMELIKGGFRTVTGLIAKANPDDYRVKTPVATIGVRGTDYSVYYGNGELLMSHDHGTPCLTNPAGSTCLGDVNKYARVASEQAKPEILKTQPEIFKVPLMVQPAVFTMPNPPPAAMSPGPMTRAEGDSQTTAEGGATKKPTPPGSDGSFCIK